MTSSDHEGTCSLSWRAAQTKKKRGTGTAVSSHLACIMLMHQHNQPPTSLPTGYT